MLLILASAVRIFGEIFVTAIVIRALLSWFARDPYSSLGKLYITLCKFTEPVVGFCRRIMNKFFNTGMIDFSPVVAILLVQITVSIVSNILRTVYFF